MTEHKIIFILRRFSRVINAFLPSDVSSLLRVCKNNPISRDMIRVLDLSRFNGNLDPLRNLASLQKLDLDKFNGNLDPLRNLVSLQTLYLNSFTGNLDPLRNLVSLQTLYLNSFTGNLDPLRN